MNISTEWKLKIKLFKAEYMKFDVEREMIERRHGQQMWDSELDDIDQKKYDITENCFKMLMSKTVSKLFYKYFKDEITLEEFIEQILEHKKEQQKKEWLKEQYKEMERKIRQARMWW